MSFFKYLLYPLAAFVVLLSIWVAFLATDLPSVETLKNWKPPEATTIYDYKGRPIGDVAIQRRYYVPLSYIPKYVQEAFIAAEDRNFYRHFGVDPIAIARALVANLLHREVRQGASTITQQLARNLFLTPERTLTRKIKEALLAIKIERTFSKDKILEMYLNYIYLGQGAYGVEAASRIYFGKSVKDLTLDEAALLAGLPKAPSKYNPFRNPQLVKERRDYVLKRMLEDGYITQEEYARYVEKPVKVKLENRYYGMDYFIDYVKSYLVEKYGEAILAGGYKVYTTLDRDLQNHARTVLERGVLRVAKANGIPFLPSDPYEVEKKYQDQKVELKPGKVLIGRIDDIDGDEYVVRVKDTVFRAKRGSLTFERGDFVLVKLHKRKGELGAEVLPDLEGALVALDAKTGAIRAMVGGYSYLRSSYNRAVYAERQPGSAIKPIIYLAALMKGYTQVSTIDASPRSFYDPSTGKKWTPSNYEGAEYGTVTLRTALAKSINTATVNLLADIGFDLPIEIGHRLGIELKPYYSMALGSIEVTPLQLTSAFQAFASLGMWCRPYFIEKIVGPNGELLEKNQPSCQQVLPAPETRVLVDMLRAVVTEGTAVAASSLGRIVAGKTGTTNDYMDAWFVGFSPYIVAGVWVGFDVKRSMGKGMAGARVALPIWIDFMSVAAYKYPNEDFPLPPGTKVVNCPTPMVFVEGTEGACQNQPQENDELEGIVDPNLWKKEAPPQAPQP
ncbi:penicillin-binding protein, 1A family [Thermocrinis albus DSM 14484]|uniref:Penicillin-binding protein, 1A family n=1 Tax=Thermocrinis albus (strain DSM 14484 / JCM 11386 / HI 11/12) TaxID=638303 RepID=D3SM79_THEAH|nr:PBP1A family penicillin-binding protein [Thermocrinis albus]ADC89859.1 penicillin-binding protein, 1A family [Thermocrinis albus DSM 14484]